MKRVGEKGWVHLHGCFHHLVHSWPLLGSTPWQKQHLSLPLQQRPQVSIVPRLLVVPISMVGVAQRSAHQSCSAAVAIVAVSVPHIDHTCNPSGTRSSEGQASPIVVRLVPSLPSCPQAGLPHCPTPHIRDPPGEICAA